MLLGVCVCVCVNKINNSLQEGGWAGWLNTPPCDQGYGVTHKHVCTHTNVTLLCAFEGPNVQRIIMLCDNTHTHTLGWGIMQVRPHHALSTDFGANTEEGGRDDKLTDQQPTDQNRQSVSQSTSWSVSVFTDCTSEASAVTNCSLDCF